MWALRLVWSWAIYTWGGLHRYYGNQTHTRWHHEWAVRYFSLAYRIDPKFWQARLARAVLLWRELDRPEEALKDLNALLEEDPQNGDALFNRALIAQENGRFPTALQDLHTFLQEHPQHPYQEDAQRLVAALEQYQLES